MSVLVTHRNIPLFNSVVWRGGTTAPKIFASPKPVKLDTTVVTLPGMGLLFLDPQERRKNS